MSDAERVKRIPSDAEILLKIYPHKTWIEILRMVRRGNQE